MYVCCDACMRVDTHSYVEYPVCYMYIIVSSVHLTEVRQIFFGYISFDYDSIAVIGKANNSTLSMHERTTIHRYSYIGITKMTNNRQEFRTYMRCMFISDKQPCIHIMHSLWYSMFQHLVSELLDL